MIKLDLQIIGSERYTFEQWKYKVQEQLSKYIWFDCSWIILWKEGDNVQIGIRAPEVKS